jgi:hypothetical protein
VAAGDDGLFTRQEREEIARVVAAAEKDTGVRFSVYVGALGPHSRTRARTLLGALGTGAAGTTMVAVDPGARRVEVVTGSDAARYLDDRACGLAVVAMTGQLAAGDLAGGVVNGLRTLAEHARHPRVLHTDEP